MVQISGVGGSERSRAKIKVTPEAILLGVFVLWIVGCVLFYRIGELQLNHQDVDSRDVVKVGDTIDNGSRSEVVRVKASDSKSKISSKANSDDNIPDHYMTFSTACSSSQNWQSFLFFYYAHKVSQPGKVVRIASGCSQEQQDELIRFHETTISKLSPNFSVHFTPDFARISGDNYKYYNKPFGIQHWLTHGLKYEDNKDKFEDAIIMILDPDMILLRPLTFDFTESNVILRDSKRGPPKVRKVMHGQPWASLYGFGNGPFRVDLNHVFADHTNSPGLNVPSDEQVSNYAGGPPYMATGKDMFAIVNMWCELVPRVHHVHNGLMGEMYGWSLAAAHLKLPHTLAESFMISATGIGKGEGWPLIDQLNDDEVCVYSTLREKEDKLPYVIHFCQSYWIGKWFIGKYRLDKEFLSCDKPLLLEPPTDIQEWKYDYYIKPGGKPYGEKVNIGSVISKREQFMICQLIQRLNDAATWHKDQTCTKGSVNYDKSFIFHHSLDPDNNEGGEKKEKK
jgi:hypothetical protein